MDKYPEEESKLWKKVKENPGFTVGIAALIGIFGHGFYNIRNRTGNLSMYLIELRLTAQRTLLLCILGGAGFKIAQDIINKKESIKKE